MTSTPQTQSRPSRTGAIITLVIGAILTITGPIFGVLAGAFSMVPAAIEVGDNTAEISPSGIVALDAEASVFLLAPVAELEHLNHDICSVTGPNGEAAPVSFAPASALNTLVNGQRYESFAQVTAATTGPHDITCDTDSIPVVAVPPFTGLFGTFAWWPIGGLAVSLIGVVLVIIGIVRVARKPSIQ